MFKIDQFRTADFARRTKSVPVPEMQGWFTGKKAEWIIQNIEGEELYLMREAADRNRDLDTVIKAVAQSEDKAKAIKEIIGSTDKVPDDLARRLVLLQYGTSPQMFKDGKPLEKSDAVKMAKVFPLVFDRLTNEIMILSGLGAKPGEKNGSGTIKK